MADKKKQHYVPRFYLKLFSILPKKTQLKIYNKSNNTIIPQGPLKTQAYENYFYDKKPEIENSFAELEAKSANILKEIIRTQNLPNKKEEDYVTLWFFTLVQAARTKFMAISMDNMMNNLFDTVSKHDKNLKNALENTTFNQQNTALLNLKFLLKSIHKAFDLEGKLIVNETQKPFITSDNPVMKYNQFLERKAHPSGRTGLSSKGLQIFYPINPKVLLMLFDSKVYKVGNRKQKTIYTKEEKDIESLNLLQFINSDKVVFSNDQASDIYLKKLYTRSKKFCDAPRIAGNETKTKNIEENTHSVLISQWSKEIEINLKLSFVKETTYAKKYELTGYLAEIRNDDRPPIK
ncbi:DUF4238 domain-containing protein [Aureispira sp. CCB-E]|uniref:DUF4238 domain-containing protein n=1 Tax=Aureispira sp. CCB-E TaxID=3051121 RepID=UPI0028691C1E|nr:DUF4238 domain-containing protein [Aureispira sp. CCB-E]WMX13220.1 DUF4238 domain-containing protein [Aureispira sp. CCB-E]